MPSSSPKESSEDDDRTMEEASDNESDPAPVLALVAGSTMAQAHFDVVMAEEEQQEQATPSISMFRMLQKEHQYKLWDAPTSGEEQDMGHTMYKNP